MSHRPSRSAVALALTLLVLLELLAAPRLDAMSGTRGVIALYSQPPGAAGGILLSSERVPDGSDRDQYAWDGFKLSATRTISEVRWRGAYDPAFLGSGGKVVDFVLNIYASTANGSQPNLTAGPLAHYEVSGNAGETASDVVAGVQTYDYAFTLPAPFEASAGTKYWLQIVAQQAKAPDWGLAAGAGGDGAYFRRLPGAGENYQLAKGDAAFTLLGPDAGGPRIYLPAVFQGGDG